MSYLAVLPLADMKVYLRIDDTQNETDAEITSMINSAFRYIEKATNHIVTTRSKSYPVVNSCVRVYDYPINSITSPTEGVTTEKYTTYNNYIIDDADVETLVLNVGYYQEYLVPDELIEVAKVMVKVMYYEQETNKSFREMLPKWANEYLNTNRRFIF